MRRVAEGRDDAIIVVESRARSAKPDYFGQVPLVFHTGPRRLFPLVSEAVRNVLPPERLRWISFSHFEADECGSLNEWLALALAVMHGSAWRGDGAALLRELARAVEA